MKTYIEIEFHNPIHPESLEPYTLTWETLNKSYVFLWLRELYQNLKSEIPAFSRFAGFDNSYKDMNWLSQKLNDAIEVINRDGHYQIKERADGSFSQEFSNIIHHHFENLIGDAKDPCELYWKSSPIAKGAICDLNHCIHDMESLARVQQIPTSNRGIVWEFLKPKRFKINNEALNDFIFNYDFGDICLHYGLIGKSWLEVFLDEDEEIQPEAIRPLDVLGPEFDIHFKCADISEEFINKFKRWLVEEQKQDPTDPKLGLGFLPLAKLQLKGQNQNEILERVGERSGIKSIKIYDDNKVWIQKDFGESDTMNKGYYQVYGPLVLDEGDQIETYSVPIMSYIVTGKEEGVQLNENLFKGSFLEDGHSISISVPNDGKSVVIKTSEKKRGVYEEESILIKPGEIYHLNYYLVEGYYRLFRNSLTKNE
ncbi:MAG: hypothetical protein NXH75_04540 [Halobacteriovoraceae bacterium]|nr:hypothetical protein [Halobacteriovoraceae bacterium]